MGWLIRVAGGSTVIASQLQCATTASIQHQVLQTARDCGGRGSAIQGWAGLVVVV